MAIKKEEKKTRMARDPYYAFMHIELAEKFGLPKEKMRSELEKLVSAIGNMDYAKELKTGSCELDEFITEQDYEKVLGKAKRFGVNKEVISKAAYQVVRGYLRTGEDIINDDGLETIQKDYSLKPLDMQKAILEYYHDKFE